MLHLYPHTCEVVRKSVAGSEDGTPTYADEVVWSGPCRLDSPRESYKKEGSEAPVATKVMRLATLFLPVTAVVGDDDFVSITRTRGATMVTDTWTVGTAEDAEGMLGSHHLEVEVYQERNA